RVRDIRFASMSPASFVAPRGTWSVHQPALRAVRERGGEQGGRHDVSGLPASGLLGRGVTAPRRLAWPAERAGPVARVPCRAYHPRPDAACGGGRGRPAAPGGPVLVYRAD